MVKLKWELLFNNSDAFYNLLVGTFRNIGGLPCRYPSRPSFASSLM